MDACVFRAKPASQVAIVMLCFAITGQASADAADNAKDHVVPPRFVDTHLHSVDPLGRALRDVSAPADTTGTVLVEAEGDLSTRLSFGLAVSEKERPRGPRVPVDVAARAAHLELNELARLDLSLAVFQEEPSAEGRNRVGLFVGAPTKDDHTGFTLGLEYERRLTDLVGLGVVTEWSPEGRELVAAVPTLFIHPLGRDHSFVRVLAPCAIRRARRGSSDDSYLRRARMIGARIKPLMMPVGMTNGASQLTQPPLARKIVAECRRPRPAPATRVDRSGVVASTATVMRSARTAPLRVPAATMKCLYGSSGAK